MYLLLTDELKKYCTYELITKYKAPIDISEKSYRITYLIKDNRVNISWLVGGMLDLGGLTHQIAHIITCRDDQVTKSDFGFRYGTTIDIFGQLITQFNSTTHIEVEIETMWVELLIKRKLLGIKEDTWNKKFIESLKYLPDILNWVDIDPTIANLYNFKYEEAYLDSLLKYGKYYFYKKWNKETIISEYKRKIKILNNYFEMDINKISNNSNKKKINTEVNFLDK